MSEFRVIRIEGDTPYDRGFQYGQEAREEIFKCIRTYQEYFIAARCMPWEEALIYTDQFAAYLEKDFGRELEEVRGIADGAGVSFREIMLLNCRYEFQHFPVKNECTAFVLLREANVDHHVYLGQNWDNRPYMLPHTIILHITEEDGTRIMGMTEAGQLIRNGFNSYGVGLCANSLTSTRDREGLGVPANFMRRHMLSMHSLDEMVAGLINSRRTVSNNYCMASSENRAVDVEAVPEAPWILLPEKNLLTHANHLIVQKELEASQGSKFRGELLYSLLDQKNGQITVDYLKECLKNHENYPDSLCAHAPEGETDLKKLWQTNASIIYDLDTLEMDICYGPPCQGTYKKYSL
ncbi:MAG: C45 family peptidase [Lachnospiraceae bacterium]|nr:C45 family peptidase [Lachnospiraceae bacterium]